MAKNRAAAIQSLAVLLMLVGMGTSTVHAQWAVTNLCPNEATLSSANGVSGLRQGGFVQTNVAPHAMLWNGYVASRVDLHPLGTLSSYVNGVSGNQQVGATTIDESGETVHASLWNGTAASWVDLGPASASYSEASSVYADGVSESRQVGWVYVGGDGAHASLWRGNAASWLDLNPGGAISSFARGVSACQEVGEAVVGDEFHASLWSGSAESWIDLNPAGALSSTAFGVADGQQVGEVFMNGANHASLWTGSAGSWIDLNPLLASSSRAVGVSGGQQVGWAFVGETLRASLWKGSASSWVDLHSLLPPTFVSSVALAVFSDEGVTSVVGSGFNYETGHDEAILWSTDIDTDGDGIPDDWENRGVPYIDGTGAQQRYLLPGASPYRKDIYVEVDAMMGRGPAAMNDSAVTAQLEAANLVPTGTVLDRVVKAFLDSPVPPPLGVPDGLPHVALHIQIDPSDLALSLTHSGDYGSATIDCFIDFQLDKKKFFGTSSERTGLDWTNVDRTDGPKQEAKKTVYRYCIFANTYDASTSTGVAEGRCCDDFIVTLGLSGGTRDEQAGTFMHELGHSLGLDHGGGSGNAGAVLVNGTVIDQSAINWKPNYYSVMNYLWQTPRGWNHSWWQLRYSEAPLDELDESLLDESVGLRVNLPGAVVPYRHVGGTPCPNQTFFAARGVYYNLASMTPLAHVDWNGDCFTPTPGAVAADINNFSELGTYRNPATKLRDQAENGLGRSVLKGHDDWANLMYSFRDSVHYAPGAPAEDIGCNFDDIVSAFLDSIPPPCSCSADFDSSGGTPDAGDIEAFFAAWLTGDSVADVDCSGGTPDAGDIDTFFAQWLAGGC